MSGRHPLHDHLLQLEFARKFFDLFYDLTGMVIYYLNGTGRAYQCYPDDSAQNSFCRMVKSVPCGIRACELSAASRGLGAMNAGQPAIYQCHAGLTDVVVPIVVHGSLVASLSTGQVLLEPPRADDFGLVQERLQRLGIRAEQRRWLDAYEGTPILSPRRLTTVVNLLSLVANYVATLENDILVNEAGKKDLATRACRYLAAHYKEDFSIQEVAEELHLSRSYLSRLLKKKVGLSPQQYLTRLRLEEARKLLQQRDLSITAVAMAVGYQSINHFCRLFHEVEGQTPSEYRRQFVS